MIEFRQLSEGTPRDIEAATDDAEAELVNMTDAFESAADDGDGFEAGLNLAAATRGEDGMFRFVIPGGEAGEVAELLAFYDECEMPQLQHFLDEMNAKAMAEAGGEADA